MWNNWKQKLTLVNQKSNKYRNKEGGNFEYGGHYLNYTCYIFLVNFINVKKITLTDLIIALGLGLMVVGLGIKMKSASKVTEENSFVKVEKSEQALVISVNINTASSVELEVLPSIGPKIAQRIIDYRNKWGLFKRKEDIKNVSGIGEKTYEKIMDKIEI